MRPREKRHRLEPEAYKGNATVSFTACIKDHRRPFVCHKRTAQHVEFLAKAVATENCGVLIYCFMPDHLHAIITGRTAESDVKKAFERFKQVSAFNLRKEGLAWQKDFHDRVVRKSEDLDAIASYVSENPIRAGLADSPFEYHGIGSIGYDLKEVLIG
ncbi:MAG: transposase [Armatimonadetes bacterium]|nr:transposase [Armatimonadota bacterium]